MTAKECFELLVTQIHVTALAAVNGDGLPVSCIADAVFADETGLYFLTEKDGALCKCLKSSTDAVCSGVKSEDPASGAVFARSVTESFCRSSSRRRSISQRNTRTKRPFPCSA